MAPKVSCSPLVSIVIATFNRANLLPETLDSVANQSYQNWECILADDGSTDNTIEIIRQYVHKDPRFRFYHRTNGYEKGPTGAFNLGLDKSKGDFIQWFGSDDLMHPDMLLEKVKAFTGHPGVKSVFSQLALFEKEGVITGLTRFSQPFQHLYENVITWNMPVWSLSLMFCNRFLKQLNIRFDESLKRLVDYDFHSRIFIQHPHETFLLDKTLCYARRNHECSITTSFHQKENIIALERSESVVAEKIINLLLDENRLTPKLEKFFYRQHLRCISNLIRMHDNEVIESYKKLVEVYLSHRRKYVKLTGFRAGFFLTKLFSTPNFFLIYSLPRPLQFVRLNVRHAYKLLFVRGYFYERAKLRLGNRKQGVNPSQSSPQGGHYSIQRHF